MEFPADVCSADKEGWKSHVEDRGLYAHGSSRISRPGGVNGCLESSVCLSGGGAELPNHSGMRPFSLNIVPVPCGMV